MRSTIENLWIAVLMVAYTIMQLVAVLVIYALIALAVALLFEAVSERLARFHDMMAEPS